MADQHPRARIAKRVVAASGLLLAALLLPACRSEPLGSLRVVLGNKGDSVATREVGIRSAFAEYLVLPELRNELRITLASYETSCEGYRLPKEGELALVVTIATPAAQPPAVGQFDWSGHAAHGGTPERPEKAYAMPLVRVGPRAHEFLPGGGVELKELGMSEGAALRGVVGFDFPGDADHPAQSIHGSFAAKICRSSAGPEEAGKR